MHPLIRRLLPALALLPLLAATALPAQAANTAPVVLVHGFAGFGRTELLGFNYWGGFSDLQAELQARYPDQPILTAAVGPVSSNWDRATELYYRIKGGCVDYGAAHAAAAGHLRKPEDAVANGRTCYPGLYPAWDAQHPVHLVSHSMGGQTARMLVQLLAANGAPANPGLFDAPVSADWVKSVTTIATPHDGTTLAYRIDDWAPFAPQLVAGFATLSGVTGSSRLFDFKLDQWGIGPPAPGEGLRPYLDRVMAAPLWQRGLHDLAAWDLSPAGAMEANAWVQDAPGVTYFSVSTHASVAGVPDGWNYPAWGTHPMIAMYGGPGFIGNFHRDQRPMPPGPDAGWYASDGVVNTVSQPAPAWAREADGRVHARAVTVRDLREGGSPQAGAWNWLGTLEGVDHLAVIGWGLGFDTAAWYADHVARLRAL